MADNVGYTPGEGAIVAADEILGILYQRIKMTFGVDGVATDVSNDNPLPVNAVGEIVEALGLPGVARQLNAGSASANTALTTTIRRVSLFARNADIRYSVGSTSQTATATSHFIGQNERIDIEVPATPNIAVIRAGATDGILELSELL